MFFGRAVKTTRAEDAAINRDHRLARFLEVAWSGGVGGYLRAEPMAREIIAPVGTTPIVDSVDGWGIRSTAGGEAWTGTLADSTRFAGDITIMWRGILLGDPGATNSGCLVSIDYGDGAGSPYAIAILARDSGNPDNIMMFRNNGSGTYNSGLVNIGLSSLYNRPITIVASDRAGVGAVHVAVVDDHGGAAASSFSMNTATGNPVNTSAADRITVGCNLGAGRFSNSITTAFAFWSFAEQPEALLDLAMRVREVFEPSSPVDYYSLDNFTPPTPPIDLDMDFPLGDPSIDGDLLGGDSSVNLGALVGKYPRGFRAFPRARR